MIVLNLIFIKIWFLVNLIYQIPSSKDSEWKKVIEYFRANNFRWKINFLCIKKWEINVIADVINYVLLNWFVLFASENLKSVLSRLQMTYNIEVKWIFCLLELELNWVWVKW